MGERMEQGRQLSWHAFLAAAKPGGLQREAMSGMAVAPS